MARDEHRGGRHPLGYLCQRGPRPPASRQSDAPPSDREVSTMSEIRELLDSEATRVTAHVDALDQILGRVVRRRRAQQLRAALLALTIAALAIGFLIRALDLGPQPASITPDNVKDLKVAWKASVDGMPAGSALNRIANPVAGSSYPNPILWSPGSTDDAVYTVTASGSLSAFPTSCGSDAATCKPIW